MRIFLLQDYYSQYLDYFGGRWAKVVRSLSYHDHREFLFKDYFGSFISYRNYFRELGHTCELVVGNYSELQSKWAHENGMQIGPRFHRHHHVVLAQIEEFRPDVVFVNRSSSCFGPFMKTVQSVTPNIFAWISCPFDSMDLDGISCIISSANYFVSEFRKRGKNSEKIEAAFDREILQGIGSFTKDVPVSFVGGLHAGTHSYRIKCLENLIEDGVPLKIWGVGLNQRWLPFGKSPIEKCYQGECFGMEMFHTLARSQITLNFHIDIIKGHNWAGNMRMYEATGCGSMLITDFGENLSDIFTSGLEIETFAKYAELKEKIFHYLSKPQEAHALAKAGQDRCLKEHGYASRIRDIESIFNRYSI